jgi:hypothetical protein
MTSIIPSGRAPLCIIQALRASALEFDRFQSVARSGQNSLQLVPHIGFLGGFGYN